MRPATLNGQFFLPTLEPKSPEAYVSESTGQDGQVKSRFMPAIKGGCEVILLDDLTIVAPDQNKKVYNMKSLRFFKVYDCGKINCLMSEDYDPGEAKRLGISLVEPKIIEN